MPVVRELVYLLRCRIHPRPVQLVVHLFSVVAMIQSLGRNVSSYQLER